MSAPVSYRTMASASGPSFLVIGLLSRLPASMGQMGTLTLATTASGSYAIGGAVAGVLGIATALGSPVFGSLTDRLGQRWVLVGQSITSALGFALMVVASLGDNLGLMFTAAAVAGFFVPQVGVMARVRWRAMAGRRPRDGEGLVSTAYAYESVVDELGFVLGPALIGILAAIADPRVAILVVIGLLLFFAIPFAVHPSVRLVPRGAPGTRRTTGLNRGLLVVALAMFGLGCLFGSLQSSTTVFATEQGVPGAAGLLYACSGLGSAIVGFLVPRLPVDWSLVSRLRVFAAGLLVLVLPLLVVSSIPTYAGALLLLGVCLAPYMITCYTLVERVVRPERLAGATSLLPATINIGYAVSASVAGTASDAIGFHGAVFSAMGAVLVMNLVAVVGGIVVRRAMVARAVQEA